MQFEYVVLKSDRKSERGVISAENEVEARELLEKDSRRIILLKRKSGILSMEINLRGVTAVELLLFIKQLAIMLRVGISIFESLTMLREQAQGRLKVILGKIISRVSAGEKLSDALGQFSNVFSDLIVQVIAAGEISGTLDQNLDYVAEFLERDLDFKRKVRAAMLYPMIVFTSVIGLVIAMGAFVFPKVIPVFSSLKAELPLTTKIMLWFANLLQDYGVEIGVAFGATVVLFPILLRVSFIRPIVQRLTLHLPVFKRILKKFYLARFFRILGTLFGAGITIDMGLRSMIKIIDHAVFKSSASRLTEAVTRGGTLSNALEEEKHLFPLMCVHMVRVGERSGQLKQTFDYLGAFYEDELNDDLKNLGSLVEPILLLFVGLMVAFVAVSVIGPIYSLYDQIG